MVVSEPFLTGLHLERRDDDLLDRLNHKATTCMMALLIFVQTFYQVSTRCYSFALQFVRYIFDLLLYFRYMWTSLSTAGAQQSLKTAG